MTSQDIEPASSKTYAQRRKDASKDALRNLLQGQEYLRQLHGWLGEELTGDRLAAVRLKADIALRLLAKCLPDQKSVEVTGEIEHRYVAEVPAISASPEQWQQQHTPPSLQ